MRIKGQTHNIKTRLMEQQQVCRSQNEMIKSYNC